jgi:hypothetical protein
MALMITEVYDAFRAASVPDETARKAAEALGDLVSDVRLLKWMVGTNVVLTIAMLGAIGGLYLRLFDLASRLPR